MLRRAVALVAFALCILIAFGPAFLFGLPDGHDVELHWNWTNAFAGAISWDQPYPRWLPDLWRGTGAADFYFYPPLAYYLAALSSSICPGCETGTVMSMAAVIMRMVAAYGMFGLCAALGRPRVGVAAGCLLILGAYHDVNWNTRMAFGEIAGSAMIPLFFWGLLVCLRTGDWRRLAVATCLVALSHLPTLVICGFTTAIASLTVWRPQRAELVSRAGAVIWGIGFGLGVSAFYWLPAMSLLQTVQSYHLMAHTWHSSFMAFDRLYEMEEPFFMVQPLVMILIGGLGAVMLRWHREVLPIALLLLGLILFMVNPLSWPVWEHTPFLGVLQFSWRFLTLMDLAVAIILGVVWSQLSGMAFAGAGMRGRVAGLLGSGMIALFVLVPWGMRWIDPPVGPLKSWIVENRMGPFDWLGNTGSPSDGGALWRAAQEFEAPPPVSVDVGSATLIEDTPLRLVLRTDCPDGCRVQLARGYWQFWEITQTDGPAARLGHTGHIPMLTLEADPGIGRYTVMLVRPEIVDVAVTISYASLALILIVLLFRRRRSLSPEGP